MPARFRFLLVLVCAFALSACGKRGPLDAPPGLEKPKTEAGEEKGGIKPKRTPITAPKRDLLIDSILE